MKLFASAAEVVEIEESLTQLDGQARARALVALAWQLRQRDGQRALQVAAAAEKLLSVARWAIQEQQCLLARLLLVQAEIAWLRSDLIQAKKQALDALTHFTQHQNKIGMGDAKWLLSSIAHELGDIAGRDDYLQLAHADYRAGKDATRADACAARAMNYAAFQNAHATTLTLEQVFDSAQEYDASVTTWLASARGVIAALTGNPGGAIKFFLLAHRAGRECGQLRQAILSASNGADSFATLGDLESALEWNERALELARANNWPGVTGTSLIQLGNVLRMLQRYPDAKAVLSEATTVMSGLQDSNVYALALLYLGDLMIDMDDPDTALTYYQQAAVRPSITGEPIFLLRCKRGQANAMSRLGRPDEATHFLGEALLVAEGQGNADEQIKILRIYAAMHREYTLPMPVEMQAPSPALYYLQRAIAVAAGMSGYSLPAELLDDMAESYAAIGDYHQAYQQAQAAAKARDSSRLLEARNRAIAMQVRYDTERARADAEHHRLLAETEATRAAALQEASLTLEALSCIGREITASLDSAAVFATMLRHVNQLLDVTTFSVSLLDAEGTLLSGAFGIENGQPLPLIQIPIEHPTSITARCARERREVMMDVSTSEIRPNYFQGTIPTVALLFSPLMVGDRLMGVMTIQSTKPNAYGERERSIFRTLCAYGAIALDNAAAYQQLESTLKTLREAQTQLEEITITDSLTGLHNRRFLLQHIESDISIILRSYNNLSADADSWPVDMDLIFFMVDLDHFKSVNDTYGHAAGDQVLVQMRVRLQEVFRESDYLVRWGGEEFLLVARATSRHAANMIAERIRVAVASRPFDLGDGVPLWKTCSIGYASYPFIPSYPRLLSWAQVVELADQGLYMAKHGGRNGWVGLSSTAKTQPDNLFQRLLLNQKELIEAGELAISNYLYLNIGDTLTLSNHTANEPIQKRLGGAGR